MKKGIIFLAVLLNFSFCATAQLNYIFKVAQSTYKDLSNGVSPQLDAPTPNGYYENDEGFANGIPIGFTFIYSDISYNKLNINVNGFICFGDYFDAGVAQYQYFENDLKKGTLQTGIFPIIAPLWDDLKIEKNSSLKYQTEGTAPNRIFTVEWGDAFWSVSALKKALKFQVKLYEGSNKIEFLYSNLDGTISNATASVGLASSEGFLSVNELTSNASVSSELEFKEIKNRPENGVSYIFYPAPLAMPKNITVNAYSSRKINFSWLQSSNINCDYAVTSSPFTPNVYNNINLTNVTAENLAANTKYYIHLRTNDGSSTSAWRSIQFTTAYEASLPYAETFSTISSPKLPTNTMSTSLKSTTTWKTKSTKETGIRNVSLVYEGNINETADAWFIMPAVELDANYSYRLKFSYKATDSLNVLSQKLEIRMGRMLNGAITGWNLVSKNYNINNRNYKDTSLFISPQMDDTYFFAFRCTSDNGNGSLWIDNIEVEKVSPLSAKVLNFTGIFQDGATTVKWKTNTEYRNSKFELQKSVDNSNFSTISTVASQSVNGISATPLDYSSIDNNPDYVSYYRLKVIDLDGNYGYTQSIKVLGQMPTKLYISKIYPIPARDIITLSINSHLSSNATLRIFDISGTTIQEFNVFVSTGDNLIKLDLSKLPPGTYFTKLFCKIGGSSDAKKLIKM